MPIFAADNRVCDDKTNYNNSKANTVVTRNNALIKKRGKAAQQQMQTQAKKKEKQKKKKNWEDEAERAGATVKVKLQPKLKTKITRTQRQTGEVETNGERAIALMCASVCVVFGCLIL